MSQVIINGAYKLLILF